MCWNEWKKESRAILIGIIIGLGLIIANRFQFEVNLSAIAVGAVAFVSAWLAQDAEGKRKRFRV